MRGGSHPRRQVGEAAAAVAHGFEFGKLLVAQAAAALEVIVSPAAPVAPSVGQLWHQTGVKSETVPKLESVLWADWVIAGLVREVGGVVKQGTQVCDFQEALACAHGHTRWLDCEFIYTYDGSTWRNA
jgi:hypothetical protein